MLNDIYSALKFYALIEFFGIVAWPITLSLFGSFSDRGMAFSKAIGILLTTWLIWISGCIHILSFSRIHSIVALGLVLMSCWCGACYFQKCSATFYIKELKDLFWGKNKNHFAIWSEILFVLCFFCWSFIRCYRPELIEVEKFPDYGFILSSYKSHYFPPLDHFLSGEKINYYYLGHLITAMLSQISGVVPNIAYNLQMANLFALGVIESFSLGSMLYLRISPNRGNAQSLMVKAGFLSAAFTMFCGNLHFLIFFPQRLNQYWFSDATRYIPNTIHEFPIYSFILNDLHGHVSDIPFCLLNLAFFLIGWQRLRENAFNRASAKNLFYFVSAAFCLGACYAVSSWDFAIYLLLFLFLIGIHYYYQALSYLKKSTHTIGSFLIFLSLAIVFWLPHWLTMHPPTSGIGVVKPGMSSPIVDLLVVWGLQGFFALSFWFLNKLKSVSENFIIFLFAFAFLLICIPEVIYLKDIYLQTPRSVTLFKFSFQAWIILGITCAPACIWLWQSAELSQRKIISKVWRTLAVILICSSLGYPIEAISTFILAHGPIQGLDGEKFLSKQFESDYLAINWINTHISEQDTILEAVGDSYTMYARISTFTGLPTVLGWPNHEWLWRSSYDQPIKPISKVQLQTGEVDTVARRRADVATIYESTNIATTEKLLNRYNIKYIYIGSLEFEKYKDLNWLTKLTELSFKKIYDAKNVQIWSR